MKDGQGFAKKVTLESLDLFAPLLSRRHDSVESATFHKTGSKGKPASDPARVEAEKLFTGKPFKVPQPRKEMKTPLARKPFGSARPSGTHQTGVERGPLVWQKSNLPASDVQRQAGHPTGGLRLTQAGWIASGRIIDQTTYFREEVFAECTWTRGVHRPKQQEVALIPFRVVILGEDLGIHQLAVSHKPSGEAGQGNYTSMLHWRDIADIVKKLNLVGMTFRLYAPQHGEEEPYHIEIIAGKGRDAPQQVGGKND